MLVGSLAIALPAIPLLVTRHTIATQITDARARRQHRATGPKEYADSLDGNSNIFGSSIFTNKLLSIVVTIRIVMA